MLTNVWKGCLGIALISVSTSAVKAQEVVHAVTGTVTSIDASAKTIKVDTRDGSEGLFQVTSKPEASLEFDKDLRNESTPAGEFTKTGAHVVVFYCGDSYVERKAIALMDLGPGPFANISGTEVKFDKHQHRLTIKDASGAEQTLDITPKTVVGTAIGPIEGYKFHPDQGEQLQVTESSAGGANTAVFIREQ